MERYFKVEHIHKETISVELYFREDGHDYFIRNATDEEIEKIKDHMTDKDWRHICGGGKLNIPEGSL